MEEGDDIWVCIRNPKLMPPGEMTSSADGVEIGPDGIPVDAGAATSAVNRMGAKLIVAMRVYDPTVPVELDEHGNEIASAEPPPLLPTPVTPETVAKLPLEIISWLGEEIGKVNPQQTPESPGGTGKTS